jgi:flavin-dependent dehydrogenase
MVDRPADLVVIGFGPAGAALALRMAIRGFQVVVVEQHRVPRDRLCGEFMSPDAMDELDVLGLRPELRAVAPPPIARVRLTAAGGQVVERPLGAGAAGLSRLELDRMLADRCREAGVTVIEQWRATGVESHAEGAVVRGVDPQGGRAAIAGRVAVGAFGKGAGPGGARGARSRFIAWKAHHRGAGPDGAVELHAFPGGYCGVAPIEGGRWNVCGLATRAAFEAAGATMAGLLAWAGERNPALGSRLALLTRDARALAVADLDFDRRAPVVESRLQLGDAAAGIAPLAGDGIGMALASAALADAWLGFRLAGGVGEQGMLAGYVRDWHRTFRRRLAVGAVLQELFLAPRAAGATLRLLAVFPGLTDRLVRATRDHPAVTQPIAEDA